MNRSSGIIVSLDIVVRSVGYLFFLAHDEKVRLSRLGGTKKENVSSMLEELRRSDKERRKERRPTHTYTVLWRTFVLVELPMGAHDRPPSNRPCGRRNGWLSLKLGGV